MNKEHAIVITIGGPPGSGTTTIAKAVAREFGLRFFSTGSAFRKIAKQRNLKLEQLSKTAELAVDLEVDNASKQEALKGNVVIESDIAAHVNANAKPIKIWLAASLETRAYRIFNDTKKRIAEKIPSYPAVKKEIELRFNEDMRRYREYYGIDLNDMSIYDLIVDTEKLTQQEVTDKVINFIRQKIKKGKLVKW